jgi:hypothetical protein
MPLCSPPAAHVAMQLLSIPFVTYWHRFVDQCSHANDLLLDAFRSVSLFREPIMLRLVDVAEIGCETCDNFHM